jgi:hypothetical protein
VAAEVGAHDATLAEGRIKLAGGGEARDLEIAGVGASEVFLDVRRAGDDHLAVGLNDNCRGLVGERARDDGDAVAA